MRSFILLLVTAALFLPHYACAKQHPAFRPHPGTVTIRYHIGIQKYEYIFNWSDNIDTTDFSVSKFLKPALGGSIMLLEITAKRNLVLDAVDVTMAMDTAIESVFCNGFQSWTTSKEYRPNEKIKRMGWVGRKLAGHYGDYNYIKYPSKKGLLHSWTYTYTRAANREIYLMGSLSENEGYTLFKHNAKKGETVISKDCTGMLILGSTGRQVLDVYLTKGSDNEVFKNYGKLFHERLTRQADLELVKLNGEAAPALGWTSWYHYYTKISRDTILSNLHAFRDNKIPIGFFQIDDGYQQATGDWLKVNEKFPGGMKPVADSIHAAGIKAGIWLAPFICEKNSDMFRNHPDWLLKNKKGEPLAVGINPLWSGKYYAVDIYNGNFRKYLKTVLDTVLIAWNYDLIKVDFLFAAAIRPPAGRTRGEVMNDAMILLRQYSGDKLILGCGVPLGQVFQLTDYCRVSSDVHMKWEQRLLKWAKARERLSCWNNLTTTIGRWQLGGNMFQNDPDVYVLRDGKNKLKKEQKHTMFVVNNLLGNLIFTSDNINQYTPDQLQLYRSAFPYLEKKNIQIEKDGELYKATFEIEDRHYVAYINLSRKGKTCVLDKGTYYDNHTNTIAGKELKVKGYQTVCLYRSGNNAFEVLGGKGALFAGSEVKSLELINAKELRLTYKEGADKTQPLLIKVPNEFSKMKVNGKEFPAGDIGGVHGLVFVP